MKRKLVRHSTQELKALRQSGKSRTDWARVKTMTDADSDFSDSPEVTPEQFARALMRKGFPATSRKIQLTLRLDAEVLDWFKAQGPGYQTRINALLCAYREAHRNTRSKVRS